MKTLLMLPVFVLFLFNAEARPFKKTPKKSLATQLADYIASPDIIRQTPQTSVVVVSFQVSADQKLSSVRVHTNNLELNKSLILQLTGKKIDHFDGNDQQTQWVRVRFLPEN